MSEQSAIIELQAAVQLTDTLNEYFGKLIVVIFYAQWNEESLKLRKDMLSSIALFGQFDNVIYVSASAEKYPQIFTLFQVQYIPTVIFTDPLHSMIAKFQTQDAAAILDALAEQSQYYRSNFQKQKQVSFAKINRIIAESPALLFTTVNRSTDSVLQDLLKKYGIQYATHSFSDSKLPQWVGFYSGCSTFPQLFINGALLGDTNYCHGLEQKGEFLARIPKSCHPLNIQNKLEQLLNSHKVLILIDKFSSQPNQEALVRKLQQQNGNISLYNVAIDRQLHNYVIKEYKKKLPLIFIDGKLQQS